MFDYINNNILSRCHSIADLRRAAKRRLPKAVFGYLDGGIRRGADVIKALCLGASAVMVGRACLFGLGAGGEAGVRRALNLLGSEIRRNMALLGCSSVQQLDGRYVREIRR